MKNITDTNKRVELLKEIGALTEKATCYYNDGIVDAVQNIGVYGERINVTHKNVLKITDLTLKKTVYVEYESLCKIHSIVVYAACGLNWKITAFSDIPEYSKKELICRVLIMIDRTMNNYY